MKSYQPTKLQQRVQSLQKGAAPYQNHVLDIETIFFPVLYAEVTEIPKEVIKPEISNTDIKTYELMKSI